MKNAKVKWAVVLFGPLVVTTTYNLLWQWLSLWRWDTRWFSPTSEDIAFCAAIAFGALAVSMLHVPAWKKALLLAVYIPVTARITVYFSFIFLCIAFSDCL